MYTVVNNNNVERLVIAKLDGNGALTWTKTYGDQYTDPYALAEVGDAVVAVGRTHANSQYDGYLVRAAKADGSPVWEQKVPTAGTYNEALFGVSAAPGGLIATGYTYAGSAGDNGWVLRLNAKGALACTCTGSTCDDGQGCTADVCILGMCKGKPVSSGTVCKEEGIPVGKCDSTGKCVTLCGNKTCDGGENNINCAADCTTKCGNGVCESGENSTNCPSDCKPHICDSYCGSKYTSSSGSICYCDATCKGSGYGDCCGWNGATGSKNYACSGSTCGQCK
ncbi:MAG: hypothetical protein FJ100_08290 [Deltaproteobacteria bacterium]|nr:hypothetical protein [Deltaproteobacteria bacterium]